MEVCAKVVVHNENNKKWKAVVLKFASKCQHRMGLIDFMEKVSAPDLQVKINVINVPFVK